MELTSTISLEFVKASVMVKKLDNHEKTALCAGIIHDISTSTGKDPEKIAQFVLSIVELGDELRRE